MIVRLVVAVLGVFLTVAPTLGAVTTYRVDTSHSSVVFSVKRMDVVNVYGRFNGLQGTLVVDSENPARSSVELELRSEAVDTDNERRDNHLRSPDFFNAAQFPVIRFKSTGVRALGENRYEVTGDLTLHGVTRSITAEAEMTGSGQDPRRGSSLIGFETTFTLKRSDFGMNFMMGPLGDDVRITIAVHGMSE
jgi:polyisoprenoid-binding protein YceI